MADPWDSWDDERLWGYLRGDKGAGHASRAWLRDFLAEHEVGSLLDIGCGTGVEYEGIAGDERLRGLAYTGVDTCERAVKLARKAFPKAKWRAGISPGWPAEHFDAVLLRHTLEHQENFQPLVQDACLLASRAVVIITFCEPGDADRLHTDAEGVHYNTWSLPNLCAALGAGGCSRVEVVRGLGPDRNTAIVGWKEGAAE